MSVLVWIEQLPSGPLANSWEVLGAGRKLAASLGAPLVAAVIGSDTAAAAEAARTYGQERTLLAMLSRSVAGIKDKTLLLALPGSTQGARESMDALFPSLLHIFRSLK